ncbi:MAG TPA: glycosyltransferase family 9 protein [Verrucomicrobiae bacterium]
MPDDNSSAVLEPRRILVRGVNWLGDAVMTLPALARLRQRFPDASITLFTSEKLADLWSACRSIDGVLTFVPGEGAFPAGRRLRAGSFDTALVLPNSPRSALEVWLAGIGRRIGFARPWRNFFLTDAIRPRPGHLSMHKRSAGEVQRLIRTGALAGPPARGDLAGTARTHQLHEYLHLAAVLGADPEPLSPRLELKTADVEAARTELRERLAGARGEPVARSATVFLGMSASAAYGPAKRWPADRFASVAREVSRRMKDVAWLGFGDTRDRDACEQIAAQAKARFINLAGTTSLRGLMRFLAVSKVLLTNDSGPMHVAAALGTPVVALFGSTSPALTGPGLPGDPRHHLLSSPPPCSPCFRRNCPVDLRCLTGITVERVLNAVLDCFAHTIRDA